MRRDAAWRPKAAGTQTRPLTALALAVATAVMAATVGAPAASPSAGAASLLGPIGAGPAPRAWNVLSAAAARRARLAPAVAPGQRLRVGFVLAPARPRALAAFAAAAANPASPLYRHFLGAGAVAARFGPASGAVAADRALLARLGYTDIVRRGWVLYATASVRLIDRSLGVSLRRATWAGQPWLLPLGSVRLPAAMRGVALVTGLVRRAAGGNAASPAPGASAARRARAFAAAPGVGDGYQAQVALLTPAVVPTGLPATVRVTVLDPQGAPDQTAAVTAATQAPGAPGTATYVTYGPDDRGEIAVDVTADTPGAYALTLSIQPAAGVAPLSVALPTLTFGGGPAAPGPIAPALVDAALGAQALVADAPSRPAAVGIYAQSAPDLADLSDFESDYALAPASVQVVPVGGGQTAPTGSASAQSELTLDLESAAIAAPGGRFTVYAVDPSLDWVDGLVQAIDAAAAQDQVATFSVSWGATEAQAGLLAPLFANQALDSVETAVEAANAEGITVVAAAGDQGAFANVGGQTLPLSPAVSLPGDLADVTAVGGVDMRCDPSGANLATAAWGGDTWAAVDALYLQTRLDGSGVQANVLGGGGYSADVPVPAWQAAVLPAGASGRGVPDLALPASANYPGIRLVFGGAPGVSGGTSMAAPLFAGYLADMAAEAGRGFGDLNPALYQAVAADPTIVTQALYGYDGQWSVGTGAWNPLTGLGTPDMDALARSLSALAPADTVARLTASPTAPTDVAAGTPLVATFSAVDAAGRPVAGVPIAFGVDGGLRAAALGAAQATTDAQGRVSVAYTDGDVGDRGAITARVAGGGPSAVTGTITVTPPVPQAVVLPRPALSTVAGRPLAVPAVALDGAGARIAMPVPVQVAVRGPRTRIFAATIAGGVLTPIRLVKAGAYVVTVSAGQASASLALTVLPGAPALFRYRAPRAYVAGAPWREGLAAYDRFGNLDTRIRGSVLWTWRLDGRVYRARAPFVDGVAWAGFVVPATAHGPLTTRATPTWQQG